MQAASEGGNLVAFKYGDVRRGTKNFSEKIGGGSFGSVYKGTLPGGGVAIAVKKLEGRLCVGEKQFRNEVRTIGVIQHVNLVRLRGFCATTNERLLVYDYMPNGSLASVLSESGQSSRVLDWRARFGIMAGVARGLAYLHERCQERIVHCDVKPENILLDAGLRPKVADFGMAKLIARDSSRALTTVRGTVGYLAPEWILGLPITAKADVYSFGMVLLEVVSGRRNYGFRQESVGSEDWYFPKWAYEKVYVERRIEDILDPRIAASCAYDDAASVATVERMVKTAMWCLQDRAEMRPSMGKVAKMLEGSVEITEPVKPTIFCVQDD